MYGYRDSSDIPTYEEILRIKLKVNRFVYLKKY